MQKNKNKNQLPNLDSRVPTETGWLLYNQLTGYPVFKNKKPSTPVPVASFG